MRRQVAEALVDRIETGFGPQKGKPRRSTREPNEEGLGIDFKGNLQEVPAVQAQYRPAVGSDVSNAIQAGVETFHGFAIRYKNQVVNLSCGSVLLVYGAYFHIEKETNITGSKSAGQVNHVWDILILETKEPIVGFFQHFLNLRRPLGMREVTGCEHTYTLSAAQRASSTRLQSREVALEYLECICKSAKYVTKRLLLPENSIGTSCPAVGSFYWDFRELILSFNFSLRAGSSADSDAFVKL